MRSVADRLRRQTREESLRQSPTERILQALALGERDLEAFRRREGIDRDEAVRRIEARRQAGRTPCVCLRALV